MLESCMGITSIGIERRMRPNGMEKKGKQTFLRDISVSIDQHALGSQIRWLPATCRKLPNNSRQLIEQAGIIRVNQKHTHFEIENYPRSTRSVRSESSFFSYLCPVLNLVYRSIKCWHSMKSARLLVIWRPIGRTHLWQSHPIVTIFVRVSLIAVQHKISIEADESGSDFMRSFLHVTHVWHCAIQRNDGHLRHLGP